MSEAFYIRRATADDAEELFALIQRAMAVYAKNSAISSQLDSQKESVEDLREHIKNDYVLVAIQGNSPAGTVRLVRKDSSTAYFSRFAVLPHIRRTGIGRQLYLAAEDWLSSQGFQEVILHTALANRDLVAFYEARGFVLQETNYDRGYARGTFRKQLN